MAEIIAERNRRIPRVRAPQAQEAPA
jgi:hypothetical protein